MQSQTKFRNIFTLYDLLGYFIPGAALLLALGISLYSKDAFDLLRGGVEHSNLDNLIIQLATNWVVWLVVGLVVTYLIGHVIAALSSMILEKFVVNFILEYPTKNMLRTWKAKQNSIEENHKSKDRAKRSAKLCDKIVWNLIFGYRRSMGNETVALFRQIFIARFGDAGSKVLECDTFNIFAMCFASIKECCPVTYERVMNYVSSYGFSRNSAMSFLVASIIVLTVYPFSPFKFATIVMWVIFFFALFRQYLKFMRRVNDEVFFQFMIMNWHLLKEAA